MTVAPIIDLCIRHGYLTKNIYKQLKIGPTGVLLKQNLINEWFNNIVINKDVTVFMDNGDFENTFEFAQSICFQQLPFGIAQLLIKSKNELVESNNNCASNLDDIKLVKGDSTKLSCSMFVPQSNSVAFFHQWQKQRRMWWRKFSASPGRYHLTDIKNGNDTQNVDITVKYPWNTQCLESIVLYNTLEQLPELSKAEFKINKKSLVPSVLVSEIDLATMFLNTISDAYDECEYKNTHRILLRLHRKLTPYKISFTVTGSSSSLVTELNELALYLTRQLRSNNISTLLLPHTSKLTQESQWRQFDELGIPYNVVLNENTLKNGISQLRSRDTTLKEEVHVTDLVKYVEQLYKNY